MPLPEKLEAYETDALTDHLLGFLRTRDSRQPFFAVLSVQPPHNPHVAPPEYAERHRPEDISCVPTCPTFLGSPSVPEASWQAIPPRLRIWTGMWGA